MRMNLSNLVLEITRKCNMKCEHCLRGAAQRIDMSTKIIDTVTTAVDSIFCLTLTGGEPSLNSAAIEHLRWSMYFNNCNLDSFWLTTNARFYKPDFEKSLIELYSVCNLREDCTLTISGDEFHYAYSNKAYEKYMNLPFYRNDKMHDIGFERLVDDGYARKNNIGSKAISITPRITDFYYYEDDSLYIGDLIYINAKGDVVLDCDLSYRSQRKHSIGNILHEKLEDIIIRNIGHHNLVA